MTTAVSNATCHGQAERDILVSRFTDLARTQPGEPAVITAGRSITYAALDQNSDALARQLATLGVGPGALVAAMTERDAGIATAYLGILKAGGAFLPLSIDAPPQRNRSILRESRVGVVLTTAAALSRYGIAEEYLRAAHLLDIETFAGSGRPPAVVRDAAPAGSAYVIHTSGSTGEPKGAINTDASLLNLVDALAAEIYPRDAARLNVALVAPFVFDPSIQQIFGALLQGHCLHIVPEAARFDGGALLAFLNAARIDIADGTPTHLRLLANAPVSHGSHLAPRLLLIGGEAMTPEVLRTFWARFGGPASTAIVNLYGTAECAVDATFHIVNPDEAERLGFVPIGRALPNVAVRILDDAGKVVPEGQTGEIAIGGMAVGLGYLGRSAMTRERFGRTPDGSFFYRTGDLGRMHPSGLLQCLGRRDRQIKIRGVRIEPAEVELALRDFRHRGAEREAAYCERCLLDTRHPGVTVTDGICSVCTGFDAHQNSASRYFGSEADFNRLMAAARAERRQGEHDCLLLYSGGKDSSYVLLRLIDLGYRVATFTFDNGYISRTALDNIERTTRSSGISHVTATLAQMKEVFAESLRHESTVCGGCFRALTLLSTQLARQRGINVVVTGLSRGQVFETKLKRLFEQGVLDPEEIDRRLDTHRQLFNIREDPIARAVGLKEALTGPPDEIRYVDFFRYDPASSAEVRSYLAARDERWLAPRDTGLCSTNCRINDVGIHVHQLEKGYHNYAAPLSWDVRLGITSRQDARDELAVHGGENVQNVLSEIGYRPRDLSQGVVQEAVVTVSEGSARQPVLCGYFVSSSRVNVAELRDHLARRLPEYMVPKYLIRMDALPLNASGKVDLARLPPFAAAVAGEVVPALSEIESRLQAMWREVLGVEAIEVEDNFFDLGGDSLLATILTSLVETELGKSTSVVEMFHHPTIRDMALLLQA
jgi:amino acid adenylation domain-containing protein